MTNVLVSHLPPEGVSFKEQVAACYLKYDESYLLVQRAKGKLEELTWSVPGGKLDPGEPPLDAAVREILEETQIVLEKNDLTYVGKLYIQKPYSKFIYHMFSQSFSEKPPVILNEEHIDFTWAKPDEMHSFTLTSGASHALRYFFSR